MTFGDVHGEIVSVTATTVRVRTPSSAAATVSVTVTNPDGRSATHTGLFQFEDAELVRIANNHGLPTMLTEIFARRFPDGARVTFGGIDARLSFFGTRIFARVPENGGAIGPVDVSLIRADGLTSTLPAAFTYETVAITPGTLSVAAGAPMSVSWVNPVNWYNDFFTDGLRLYRVGDARCEDYPNLGTAVFQLSGLVTGITSLGDTVEVSGTLTEVDHGKASGVIFREENVPFVITATDGSPSFVLQFCEVPPFTMEMAAGLLAVRAGAPPVPLLARPAARPAALSCH